MIPRKEFKEVLLKVAVWYAGGAPELHHFFDLLTIECSDRQWAQVEDLIDDVDEIMADSEVGSLYQKERAAARREGRPSRYPSALEVDEEKRTRQIRELGEDYRRRGIHFADEREVFA